MLVLRGCSSCRMESRRDGGSPYCRDGGLLQGFLQAHENLQQNKIPPQEGCAPARPLSRARRCPSRASVSIAVEKTKDKRHKTNDTPNQPNTLFSLSAFQLATLPPTLALALSHISSLNTPGQKTQMRPFRYRASSVLPHRIGIGYNVFVWRTPESNEG